MNTTLATPVLNLYHRWAYVDEIVAAINHDVDNLSQQLGLSARTIKIIRTLEIVDYISISMCNSFCHPNHPTQVDLLKKKNWLRAVKKNLAAWHHIFHILLQQENHRPMQISHASHFTPPIQLHLEPELESESHDILQTLSTWRQQHASLLAQDNSLQLWESLQATLLKPTFITSITFDQHLDPVKEKYAHIEPFFRGIHQITEATIPVILDDCEALKATIMQLKVATDNTIDCNETTRINHMRLQMETMQTWWEVAADNIMLLSKMDTGSYSEYRQALIGTSGGDSKQLRLLKSKLNELHLALPESIRHTKNITSAFGKQPNDSLLNQLLSSIRELQASTMDFWLRHFTLTVNTIGIIRGTQGLPVEKLLSFAIGSISRKDSLLQAVGNVGNEYAKSPEAFTVKMDHQREKHIGSTIYAHVKDVFTQKTSYNSAIDLREPLLDGLELRPLEPNDTKQSPYAAWFSPDVHAHGLRFGMHSFGTPLIIYNDSITRTTQRLTEAQDSYWKIIFGERLPQLQKILFQLLEIPAHASLGVSIEANVTTLLERLLSALPENNASTVLTTNQEFITVNRTLAANVAEKKFTTKVITIPTHELNLAPHFEREITALGTNLKAVIFSHVMSNSQLTMTPDEITSILNCVPTHIPIIIDITQSVCNVSMPWGNILAQRNNVYLLGSVIKHGRSTSGLGFLIHPQNNSVLHHPRRTGWIAYSSGLLAGNTTDANGNLLYDDALEWYGGTPSNIFAVEAFINTWDAVLRTNENLKSMHTYVRSLQDYFISLLPHDLLTIPDKERRDHHRNFTSNAMVLAKDNNAAKQIVLHAVANNIYFDYRENYGVRIGLGIQHSRKDVDVLANLLSS